VAKQSAIAATAPDRLEQRPDDAAATTTTTGLALPLLDNPYGQ
jgi:hypothetical protein